MNKNWIIVFVLAVVLLSAFFLISGRSSNDSQNTTPTSIPLTTPPPSQEVEDNATITPMNGSFDELLIEDLKEGSGKTATAGATVTVNYKGTLTNGVEFDSSFNRNQPFSFTLGEGQVIEGWEKGVSGMKVGGKRKLTIPPAMAYGERGAGTIPPNSTLIFEIELLEVN